MNYNILISGKKRSGKDFIGYHLSQYHNKKILKLSNKLYDVVKTLFNIDINNLEQSNDINIKENTYVYNDITLRKFLQTFATDFIRNQIGQDFWIDTLINSNNDLLNTGDSVITDIRFQNELEIINSRFNCINVLVINEKNTNNDNHISETPIDKNHFDIIIYNYKSNYFEYEIISDNPNLIQYILHPLFKQRFNMVERCLKKKNIISITKSFYNT